MIEFALLIKGQNVLNILAS